MLEHFSSRFPSRVEIIPETLGELESMKKEGWLEKNSLKNYILCCAILCFNVVVPLRIHVYKPVERLFIS